METLYIECSFIKFYSTLDFPIEALAMQENNYSAHK